MKGPEPAQFGNKMVHDVGGPVLIVVGIKKEKEKNSQKGKKKRERKGFP